jgi:hypothetical protein
MKSLKGKKAILQKQIPTLLGLGVLVIALVAGLLFFGDGTGVFAPRATPQTTPKNIRITNVTDKSFTVSFYTDEATPGFVKYGDSASSLKNQMGDDRDQLSGVVSPYTLHHVTVRGLEAGSDYYYVLGTGSNATFDDNGTAFQIKTAAKIASPPPASKTIYGSISNSGGTPAEGTIVYFTMPGVGDMSSLVRSSGSWALSLANARTADGTAYADITDESSFSLMAQGSVLSQTTSFNSTVADSQPMQDLVLGQQVAAGSGASAGSSSAGSSSASSDSKSDANPGEEVGSFDLPGDAGLGGEADQENGVGGVGKDEVVEEEVMEPLDLPAQEEIMGGGLTELVVDSSEGDSGDASVSESTASASFDLVEQEATSSSEKVVTVSKPLIKGKVAPGVQVSISVHSDTQIEETVVSDSEGNFVLDIADLGEELEPGPHTVTYSYTDPNTGELIEATYDFWVEDTSGLLAQADTGDDGPYGSGNPYSPTSTPSPSPTLVATQSAEASDSADTSTRSAIVSTESSVLTAGSVGTTMALVLGGLFFIFTGAWSWWLAGEVREE